MSKQIKIGVVVFPGSNCDQDMVDALSIYENVDVFKLWHKSEDLNNADLIVLPGGFSYGDYLRSGAIARFSPIMKSVIDFAARGGFVFGVCNGFQILCESNLLPGALLHNNNHQFICKNTFINAEGNATPITQSLNADKAYKIPIAHGEGRFYASDDTMKKYTITIKLFLDMLLNKERFLKNSIQMVLSIILQVFVMLVEMYLE